MAEREAKGVVDGAEGRGVAAKRETADCALADAVLAKNRKAAAEFVDRLSDPVYRYVRSRLMPRTDLADDLVQEVFLAAWGHLAAYRGESSLESWILGIARHKVESHYRKELRRHLSLDDDEAPVSEIAEHPPIESDLDRERAASLTREILTGMPETYRLLLFWRYWEKRPLAEIGRELGKTEKAIERALARARSEFKRRWDHG